MDEGKVRWLDHFEWCMVHGVSYNPIYGPNLSILGVKESERRMKDALNQCESV